MSICFHRRRLTRAEVRARERAPRTRIEQQLNQLDPHYEVNQIKEKFGTLRLYWKRDILDSDAIVDEAEAESARTCELCGTYLTRRLYLTIS